MLAQRQTKFGLEFVADKWAVTIKNGSSSHLISGGEAVVNFDQHFWIGKARHRAYGTTLELFKKEHAAQAAKNLHGLVTCQLTDATNFGTDRRLLHLDHMDPALFTQTGDDFGSDFSPERVWKVMNHDRDLDRIGNRFVIVEQQGVTRVVQRCREYCVSPRILRFLRLLDCTRDPVCTHAHPNWNATFCVFDKGIGDETTLRIGKLMQLAEKTQNRQAGHAGIEQEIHQTLDTFSIDLERIVKGSRTNREYTLSV